MSAIPAGSKYEITAVTNKKTSLTNEFKYALCRLYNLLDSSAKTKPIFSYNLWILSLINL